jgi:DNA-binding transcriptional regulator YdaS (Cro superfamily)
MTVDSTKWTAEAALRQLKRKFGNNWLAERLGITSGAVGQWKHVPLTRVRAISEITGIPYHELRPDHWPPPAHGNPQSTGRQHEEESCS